MVNKCQYVGAQYRNQRKKNGGDFSLEAAAEMLIQTRTVNRLEPAVLHLHFHRFADDLEHAFV